MKGAGRVVVLVGAPLLVVFLMFAGTFEAGSLSGPSRALALLILAAEIGCLVSGWLYAYDESRFPRAIVATGRFCILAGLFFLCDFFVKGGGSASGESFESAFVMIVTGLVITRGAGRQKD